MYEKILKCIPCWNLRNWSENVRIRDTKYFSSLGLGVIITLGYIIFILIDWHTCDVLNSLLTIKASNEN